MALDILPAAPIGTCALLGHDCCSYTPSYDSNVTDLTSHTQKVCLLLMPSLDGSPLYWVVWNL